MVFYFCGCFILVLWFLCGGLSHGFVVFVVKRALPSDLAWILFLGALSEVKSSIFLGGGTRDGLAKLF